MSSLQNKKIKDSYKDLLQVSNENKGIDDTLRIVSDGEGTESPLKLSSTTASFSGNVGIGTTDPEVRLQVPNFYQYASSNNGSAKLGDIRFDIQGTMAEGLHYYGSGLWKAEATKATIIKQRDGKITFFTNEDLTEGDNYTPTGRMCITSNGNVGIGTTSPEGKLDVNSADFDTMYLNRTSSAGAATLIFQNASKDGGAIQSIHGGGLSLFTRDNSVLSQRVTINSNGNVGIGTTSPDTKLQVLQSSATNTLTEAVSFRGGHYNSADYAESFKFFHQTNTLNTNRGVAFKSIDGSLQIQTIVSSSNASSSNNIILQPDEGNVGIGTTSPSEKLDVDGKIKATTANLAGLDFSTFNETTQNEFVGFLPDSPVSKFGAVIKSFTTGQTILALRGNDPKDAFRIVTKKYATSFSHTKLDDHPYNHSALVVQSDGNVGIGTTSPSASLTVAGDISVSPVGNGVHLGHYTGSNTSYGNVQLVGETGGYIDFSVSGVDWKGRILYNNADNYMRFDTSAGEKMRIDSDGNVGIGTTSPTRRLHVLENANDDVATFINDDTENGYGLNIKAGGTATGRYSLRVANRANKVILQANADGNVGIGTDDPKSILHLKTTDTTPNAIFESPIPSVEFIDATADSTNDLNKYIMRWQGNAPSSTDGFRMYQGNRGPDSPDLTIGPTGNVGIGDSNPSKKLSVSGDVHITGDLSVVGEGTEIVTQTLLVENKNIILGSSDASDDDTANGGGIILKGATDKSILFNKENTAFDFNIGATFEGNVGIGTDAPSANLEIKGGEEPFVIYDASNEKKLRTYTDSNGTVLALTEANQDIIRLDGRNLSNANSFFNGGNVGIGTTNPSSKLHIKGDTTINTRLTLEQTTSNLKSEIQQGSGGFALSALGKQALLLQTNGNECLRISADGNVGIGTTEPVSLLEVQGGGIVFEGEANGVVDPGKAILDTDNSDTMRLKIHGKNNGLYGGFEFISKKGDGSEPKVVLKIDGDGNVGIGPNTPFNLTGGNVGIGTTSPDFSLEVQASKNDYGIHILGETVNVSTGSKSRGGLFNNADDELELYLKDSNAAAKIHLSPNKESYILGNVGIGTDSPDARLNIANVTADTSAFKISRAENEDLTLFQIFQDSSWEDSDGVGQGSGIAHINTNNRNLAITTSGGASNLNGGVFINDTGNVGIGTTRPGAELDVQGSINVRSGYISGSYGISNNVSIGKAVSHAVYHIMISSNYNSDNGVRSAAWYVTLNHEATEVANTNQVHDHNNQTAEFFVEDGDLKVKGLSNGNNRVIVTST